MIDFLTSPWPWYVAGPLIGLFVPLLLLIGNKHFGVSSSMRHVCAMCAPVANYFKYDWKSYTWNLLFIVGILVGGFLGGIVFGSDEPIDLSRHTIAALANLGIDQFDGMMPGDLFNIETLLSMKGIIIMVVGGLLIGFGTRYADGCTSGHAIMGLSLLSLSSLIAVIGFFVGGLIMTHFLLPLILNL